MAKQGDLGYWIGYRIAKSYYQHTADKRQAVREILGMSDPKSFLARSGWYPGIKLRQEYRRRARAGGGFVSDPDPYGFS